MNKYHVYEWTYNDYILIDTETREVQFFATNYENKMGQYHIDNPKKSTISKQKISGLIKRSQKFMDMENSFVIDKYIYHLLMDDEQRGRCGKYNSSILDIKQEKFITSGNDYLSVIQDMQRIVNEKVAA